tara:strand:+ start:1087 stop:1239 length:153 start_codon:yes stop_codon:yes gene_type:complete
MKEDESKVAWILELGLYPGILLGARTYIEQDTITYVIYLPFIDISLEVHR